MKRLMFFVVFLCLGSLNMTANVLGQSGRKAQIIGQVFDVFGKPLANAVVSMEGTTFTAKTDAEGKYSLNYVPGKVKVVIRKEGYTSVSLTFDIAIETTFPAQQVTMYKVPPSQGIWLIGKSDYVPLEKGEIAFKSKEFPFSWDKPLFEDTYTTVEEFTSVGKDTTLRFLDNNPFKIVLAKLSGDNVILSRVKYWTKKEDKFNRIEEKISEIAEGIRLREVSIDEGKYAFVRLGAAAEIGLDEIGSGQPAPGALGHPITEPVFLFEIYEIEFLIKQLEDKDKLVRRHAAEALGWIGLYQTLGNPATVPTLIKALKDVDEEVRATAASALGRIGDSAAVPALIETLKEKDWHVYQSATEALKQIGTPEAMKAVEEKKNR